MESSPVQRLMNRRTRTLLPTTKALLQPTMPQTDREVKDLTRRQAQQSKYYNKHARDLPTLTEGDVVRMKPFQMGTKMWKKGIVTSRLDERSYLVETPDGDTYRRNHHHLRKTKESPDPTAKPDMTPAEGLSDTSSPTKTTCEVTRTDTPNATEITSKTPVATPKAPVRPQRTRRPPAYLKDYVTT